MKEHDIEYYIAQAEKQFTEHPLTVQVELKSCSDDATVLRLYERLLGVMKQYPRAVGAEVVPYDNMLVAYVPRDPTEKELLAQARILERQDQQEHEQYLKLKEKFEK